jgi:hypothetical protein
MSDENQQNILNQDNTAGKEGGTSGQSSPVNSSELRGAFSLSPGGANTGMPSSPAVVHINTEAKVQHTWYTLSSLDPAHFELFRVNCQIAEQKGAESKRNANVDNHIHDNLVRQMQVRQIPDATNWRNWSNDLFFINLQKTFGKNMGGTRLSAVEQISQGVDKLRFDFDPDNSAS